MTLATRIALVAALLTPAALSAQSRTAVAIAAGPSFPLAKFRDTQSSGMDYNLSFTRGSDDAPFGFRLDFGYDRMKGKASGTTVGPERKIVSGTLNFLFSFSGHRAKPYLFGGPGGFKMTSMPVAADSKTKFGWDLGAGVTLPLAGRAVYLESRINSISQTPAKPIRFVPIVLGLLF
ncbi:MAG: outer membrane beta-barrel protein [Gemmatimonadota bacterium]|nr:outer membrane beta-barrel protein [Gemmatimonadota bacterium]